MDLSEIVSLREVKLTAIEKALVTLVLVTGIIHLYVGAMTGFWLIALAGAGYMGGLGVFLFCRHRALTVAASIPFTLVQFYEYYQFYGFNLTPMAAVDKTVQTLLVGLGLYYLYANEHIGSKLQNYRS